MVGLLFLSDGIDRNRENISTFFTNWYMDNYASSRNYIRSYKKVQIKSYYVDFFGKGDIILPDI